MEIETPFAALDEASRIQSEKDLVDQPFGLKFVVLDKTRTIIDTPAYKHTSMIPKRAPPPIGGGKIKYNLSKLEEEPLIQWGSSTIEDKFGTDRPEDPTEAATILEEVKTAFIKWLQKVQAST
jgi:hypothetical protein